MMSSYDRIISILDMVKQDDIKNLGRLNKVSFTRNRKMFFEDCVKMILNKRGKTMTIEINNYYRESNKPESRITKQGFCKQRLKLNPKVFIELNKQYVESIYQNYNYKKFDKYILMAVDGTTLEIPNSKELRKQYGFHTNKQENVRTVARASASCIYDLENNIIIDSGIYPYKTSERIMAKENIKNMDSVLCFDKKIIIIFDRGYLSTEMLMFMQDYPYYFLFRMQGNSFNEERRAMDGDDAIVELKTNGSRTCQITDPILNARAKSLKKLPVRIVKVKLDSGEYEYLLTNIPSSEVPTNEFKSLYFKRWGIETAYDTIKNKLHIENFSGKKKIVIEQDFYSQILLYNMAEDLKNDANQKIKSIDKTHCKYCYKVNLNILIGTLREYLFIIAMEYNPDKRKVLYKNMIDEILENLVPIRPGRSFKRTPYSGKNKNFMNRRKNC